MTLDSDPVWESFSVAIPGELARRLARHLDKGPRQEDLSFALWRPSRGATRLTTVVGDVLLPEEGEHHLHGNASFTDEYLRRVLFALPKDTGVAFIHSHPGRGWQDMSIDDEVAERDRLASAAWGRTGLPLLGMTFALDGTWSARLWVRTGLGRFKRVDATSVRIVSHSVRFCHHPELSPHPALAPSQVATASVWGSRAQADLARTRVGIVGLGSVGSVVAEVLARTGVRSLTLIDHEVIEERNLDRTFGAAVQSIGENKALLAAERVRNSASARDFSTTPVPHRLETEVGVAAALDCDALVSCVDRPWPRFVLSVIAYAHLIPVIDGGVLARVDDAGHLIHVDWRSHTVGLERPCLYCIGALRRSDVALDREGKLDEPDYVAGLPPEEREMLQGRNVFAFSVAVGALEVLQLIGLVTGNPRVGGLAPQIYHAYPGNIEHVGVASCEQGCEVAALQATAVDVHANLVD